MLTRSYVIPSLAFVCTIALLINGPIPQDQEYHRFADARLIFGIPNLLNVITNLPFFFIALLGFGAVKNCRESQLAQIIVTLFVGFILLTFGSGYYHWSPQNITLVYDRLPMVIIFMSFFAFIIYDRVDPKIGYRAFIILNITGILTVEYWILSERAGKGDLRWYGMIQFFPVVAIPLVLAFYKSRFNHSKYIVPIFVFFILAKLAEQYDKQVFQILKNIISGHSLKHLFMAAAEYEIVVMMRRRLEGRS